MGTTSNTKKGMTMKTIKTLVRYSLFGLACSAVVVATGSLVVLPICLLCFAPVFLGQGR